MENPIFIGLSRQVALRAQMDLIANNIANMSTPGYRAQNMVFTEYLSEPKGQEDPLSFVLDYGHFQDTSPGSMSYTDNPLDVALHGPGFIGIQGMNEETAYTRAGAFEMTVDGELITSRGNFVLDDGGNPIILPDDTTDVRIAEDGTVSNQDGEIAQIMVREFNNLQDMEARGDGLYYTNEEGNEPEETRVIQGMIEGANVKPVLEVTRMIEVSRAYQSTQNMLRNEHDRQRTMIQRLSRDN